ncbi:unnamed protein product [Caenorhabditis angaria]|uniref:Transthyretin-like family protein n=1 Tax=Caenorhabditis angaria TaxID=860376 RepID=A0A9P1IPW5_9PELO|nr:unnamed protein product [Caenorhabditis angaria]
MNMKIILIFSHFILLEAKLQHVNVTGVLLCHSQRVMNIFIELWEYDRFDANDLLNTTRTNDQGEFQLTGGQNEFFSIEPYIEVWHECGTKAGCIRATKYHIPNSFIDKHYDTSLISLDTFTSDERNMCGADIPKKYRGLLTTKA